MAGVLAGAKAPYANASPQQAVTEAGAHVVLTITGALGAGIGTPEADGRRSVHLTMAMLKAMPARRLTTTTVWTEGRQTFTGVLLRDLLDRLKVPPGETLHAVGANAYAIDIPESEATDPGPIIAYARNGGPMSLRDKGPLWLVYPYDKGDRWRTEQTYAHSVWQLVHMTIAPQTDTP